MQIQQRWCWCLKATCLWSNQADPTPPWGSCFCFVKIEEGNRAVIKPCIFYSLPPTKTSPSFPGNEIEQAAILQNTSMKHMVTLTRAPQQQPPSPLAGAGCDNSGKLSATSLQLLTQSFLLSHENPWHQGRVINKIMSKEKSLVFERDWKEHIYIHKAKMSYSSIYLYASKAIHFFFLVGFVTCVFLWAVAFICLDFRIDCAINGWYYCRGQVAKFGFARWGRRAKKVVPTLPLWVMSAYTALF